ncbi:hypothetical protein RKE30_15655 [Streptomyces sp. Li-HN-5-11]|uniref:hypothetical protein n=1 Tax=Streptomyces sp. Li-HN-5-11 TaxID=3075432 RepID=UPI0028B10F80|nr:hypothetical protein [Streptomyces sp. Li-HN-5-11]WNM31742.1 hypothetical protein RKE30_15655 [Streptomyces sp. Li-HN-5-11]
MTQVRKQAKQRLRAAGVSAVVGVDDGFVATAAYDSRQVTATVSGGPAELDRARTALTGLLPDQYPTTTADMNWSENRFTQDFTTLTRVVLVVTFTVAITSAGITAAAAVLDRRRTYALLHLAEPRCASWTPPATARRSSRSPCWRAGPSRPGCCAGAR